MSDTAASAGDAAGSMRHDVFISYSHHNQPLVDAMASLLERDGVRCWYAARDITGGEEWAAAIMGAINQAGMLVLVFSEHSNASHQVRRELDLATSRELPIIPFRIEDVEPHPALRYYMAGAHWMDALTPPVEARIKALAAAARRLLDRPVPKFAASEASAARFYASLQADAAGGETHAASAKDTPAEAPQAPEASLQAEPHTGGATTPQIAALQRRSRAYLSFAALLIPVPIVVIAWFHASTDAGPLMFASIGGPIVAALALLLLRRRVEARIDTLRMAHGGG